MEPVIVFDSILGRTNSHSPGRSRMPKRRGAGLGVVEWDADLGVVGWSPSAERLTGWPAALRLRRPLLHGPLTGDRAHARRLRLLLDSSEPGDLIRDRIRRPDGRSVELEWRHEVQRDRSGAATGGFSLLRCRDDFAKESLATLFDAVRPALVLLRPGGVLVRLNDAAAALLGLPAGVCEDVELTQLVDEADRAHLEHE